MGAALSDAGLSTDIARDSERYIFVLHGMADADPRKSALLGSYSAGFHNVFVTMTVLSAAALLVSLLIRKSSMDTVRLAVPQRNRVDNEWVCRGTRCNLRSLRLMGANQTIAQ